MNKWKYENVPQNRKVILQKRKNKTIEFGIWEFAFILQTKSTNKSKIEINLKNSH